MIYIVTGGQEEGKTSFLRELACHLKTSDIPLRGFLAAGTFEANLRTKFVLEDVSTDEKELFCDTSFNPGDLQFGRFAFKTKGHEFGVKCLADDNQKQDNYIYILDEIGKLETSGKGWHDVFKRLLKRNRNIIISVRNIYLYEVVDYFGLENFRIFNIADLTAGQTAQEIIESSTT